MGHGHPHAHGHQGPHHGPQYQGMPMQMPGQHAMQGPPQVGSSGGRGGRAIATAAGRSRRGCEACQRWRAPA
jgi:hypothetical protein